jgi:membrane protease YdiL (CAAX protease family)
MTKIKHPFVLVFSVYIGCYILRLFEYFVIRTDKTFLGEAFIHKLLGILILAVLAKIYFDGIRNVGFSKGKSIRQLINGLLFGMGIFAVAYGIEVLILVSSGTFLSLDMFVTSYAIDKNLGNQIGIGFFVICILGNVINVVMEEGVFRGFFQKVLENKYSFIVSALIASALFGLWHAAAPLRSFFDGSSTVAELVSNILVLTVFSGIVGFKFALLTKMTGSLYMGMGDHFVNNTSANILHVVSQNGTDELMTVRIMIAQLLSLGIVVFAYLRKKSSS